MKCNICGAEMEDSYVFCLTCGAKLIKLPPEPDEYAPVPPEAPVAPWENYRESGDMPVPPEAPVTPSKNAFGFGEDYDVTANAPVPPETPTTPPDNTAAAPDIPAASFKDTFVPPEQPAAADIAAEETPESRPVIDGKETAAPPPIATATPPRFFDDNLVPVVSVGNWLATLLLLLLIPIAAAVIAGIAGSLIQNNWVANNLPGLVLIFAYLVIILFYAFNKRTNPSKRNFFRAAIIYTLIIIIILVAAVFALGALLMNYLEELGVQDIDQMMRLLETGL